MVKKTEHWGTVDGKEIFLFTLTNKNGYELAVTNFGGIVVSLVMPDKKGIPADIVCGFNSLDGYLKKHPYFGAIIGRYGNRIGGAHFVLNGTVFQLEENDGKNSLHGGVTGFDKQVWNAEPAAREHATGLKLSYTSRDGEGGFPGTLVTDVIYWLTEQNELEIEYHAVTDKPTVVSLTNHCYWNLAGEGTGDILSHKLQLNADDMTVVREGLIPTGEIQSIKGTPFDFTASKEIGKNIDDSSRQLELGFGYDHNWIINRGSDAGFVHAATLADPKSGRSMEVYTTEPGVQFYSANHLDGTLVGKSGKAYKKRSALCLETQHFPDSPHHPEFPSTVLKPGEIYSSKTVHRFFNC